LVFEKRRFQRLQFKARGLLDYQGQLTEAQVETLSLNGALVSFVDSVIIPEGERCALAIFPAGDQVPLRFSAEVVYSTMYRVGLHFLAYQEDASRRLFRLMSGLSPAPERLREESVLLGWETDDGR
jgi:PilZ domain-containing protein